METEIGGLGISAEVLKAYLFGKNVVPNTQDMDYFTKQLNGHLAALPPQIRVGPSTIPGQRYGVYSTVWIGQGTDMGPYIGAIVPVSRLDWTRHNDMMWEVFTDNGELSHFVDGSSVNAGQQSWISLVGLARSEFEQNLEAMQIGQDIYYRAIKPIAPGTELLVWYGSDAGLYMGVPGLGPVQNTPTIDNGEAQLKEQKVASKKEENKDSGRLKCVICRRGFNSRSNLRSHMRIHTLEKPFLCKFCHRSFSQSSTLRNHIRLHTGEKPYRCGICESAYSQLAGLRAHQKSAKHRPKSVDDSDDVIISV